MQALRKASDAEVKEEPGLRSGKRVTTQVVALAVMCRTLGRSTPGYTVLCVGRVNCDDLSCAKACCLVREPDAGNLHVRFDEEDVETE